MWQTADAVDDDVSSNYLLSQQLGGDPILGPMPGPWGAAMKRLRLEKGWSQKKVASKARMTASTYGKIEKGGHTLTSKLQAIADALSVPIDAVLIIGANPTLSEFDALVERKVREQVAQQLRLTVRHIPTAEEASLAFIEASDKSKETKTAAKRHPHRVTAQVNRKK